MLLSISKDISSKHCSCGAETDENEMEEPLLGYAADSTSSWDSHDQSRREQGRSRHEGSQALVPHSINRVNWEELWRVLWGSCRDSLAGILGEGQKSLDLCQALKATGQHGRSTGTKVLLLCCSASRTCVSIVEPQLLVQHRATIIFLTVTLCPLCSDTQQLLSTTAAIILLSKAAQCSSGATECCAYSPASFGRALAAVTD